jgi:NADH:ubiquinone oxidoreductase subunit 5 (subunit L)/multisubunit Na+/H+ antiporter MnhA subunit
LSLGGYFICLFHLVIHAFAKANLFLVVGNFIHARFSLQDVRFIGSRFQRSTLRLIIIVRIIRLRGVTFTSGFFSKDLILMTEFSLFNSIITTAVVIIIVTFTWIYCLKLVKIFLTNTFPILRTSSSSFRMSPRIILRFFSLTLGYFFIKNASLISVSKIRGAYWRYLLLRVNFSPGPGNRLI